MSLPNAPSDQEVFDTYPSVPIDRDNIEHYRGLMTGRLLINRCAACGHWVYPHRPLCPKCLSWDLPPTEVSGKGQVYMYTLIHQERSPDNVLREPMAVAAVELAEQPGLRYLTTIVNCAAGQLAMDMHVRLIWERRGARLAPVFEPAPG